jgi:mannose-1-phosphate guanylyltransferase/mannose-6-phosphate isomerase
MDRVRKDFPTRDQLLVIPDRLRKLTRKFCGPEPVVVEPVGRNTAPAICLAAMTLARRRGDGVMHVMPADHLIEPNAAFLKDLKLGAWLCAKGYLVTYGIKPDRPETGYGYIRVGKGIPTHGKTRAFQADAFMEKPDLRRARAYLKTGRYLWNAGIFSLGVRTILEEIRKFAPLVYQGVEKYLKTGDPKFFARIPDISIDYAVMEKSRRLALIRGGFQWDDVGSWLALERFFPRDRQKNILLGDAKGLEIRDMIVYTYGIPVRVYGIDHAVIVAAPNGILVCRKDKAPALKDLLKDKRRTR